MVRHKQAFLGLTWQSMRSAMKKDPNRIAQYKLFNKTLNKEFQTTLADPSRLIYKNELKHSEHTGLNAFNHILHRKTFIRHPIRDSIYANKSAFCLVKNKTRSRKLFDYLEENIEIEPEALSIDLERDYVDAYWQAMSAREQLIEKHSKELSRFCSVSMRKNENCDSYHMTVLNGNYETIYDKKKFQPPDKEDRDSLIEIFDNHYIIAFMAAEIFATVGYRPDWKRVVNLPYDPYVYRRILYSAELTFMQIIDPMTLEAMARHILHLDCFDEFSNYESVQYLMEIFQRVFLYENEKARLYEGQASIVKLKDVYVDLVLDGKENFNWTEVEKRKFHKLQKFILKKAASDD